jgi:hypothetical protein
LDAVIDARDHDIDRVYPTSATVNGDLYLTDIPTVAPVLRTSTWSKTADNIVT